MNTIALQDLLFGLIFIFCLICFHFMAGIIVPCFGVHLSKDKKESNKHLLIILCFVIATKVGISVIASL